MDRVFEKMGKNPSTGTHILLDMDGDIYIPVQWYLGEW